MRHAKWIGALLLLAGCGEASPASVDAANEEEHDGGTVPGDGGTPVDAPITGPPLHDCDESDFVDRTSGSDDSRMIMVPAGTTEFDPPCMTIREGQSVMFMWDMAAHPLGAGVAPGHPGTSTTPTPIEPQSTGSLYTVEFPIVGDYAYYCTTHFHGGMLGVVRVLP